MIHDESHLHMMQKLLFILNRFCTCHLPTKTCYMLRNFCMKRKYQINLKCFPELYSHNHWPDLWQESDLHQQILREPRSKGNTSSSMLPITSFGRVWPLIRKGDDPSPNMTYVLWLSVAVGDFVWRQHLVRSNIIWPPPTPQNCPICIVGAAIL